MSNFTSIQGWNSSRYSKGDHIKSGGFGDVYKGYDNDNKSCIALKCCPITGLNHAYKFAYRELCVLHHVRSHYLIELIDAHVILENGKITILWLVMPLIDYDLHSILHKLDLNFTFEAIIKIMYQILKGLQYLSDSGIIHRDLKPSNIGINKDYCIHILDFGLSRELEQVMTKNVQTVYYRAIEVFSDGAYDSMIDIWSAGCVCSELFTKKILFKAKKIYNQLEEIVKITGLGEENLYKDLECLKDIAPKENQLRNHIKKDITDFVCHVDEPYGNAKGAENAINLICSMLDLNPKKRPTPLHAMNSDLFKQYYDMVKHYPNDKKANLFVCDSDDCSAEILQKKIIEKINSISKE